jgi:hypothetical protein
MMVMLALLNIVAPSMDVFTLTLLVLPRMLATLFPAILSKDAYRRISPMIAIMMMLVTLTLAMILMDV